jgi:Asp-tRNA(Asn)/Glu-tRNA(Gln) amidotransferase B subunit
VNGCVDFEFNGSIASVRITRAHLEEDVGKNFHFERSRGVDFNRAGVPLLEIVSEPEITSADMAYEYLNALKDILTYGGISDCDMEKGMVRCDVNISVRPKGQKELGAKIEIKNMNSFSGCGRRWSMKSRASSTCWRKAASSCNQPVAGTTWPASPKKCAPKSTRMTTATSPSPI